MENANKNDSITGIQGYFRKNWNTLYSTIILITVYRSREVEIVVVIIRADLNILIEIFILVKY